MKRKSLLTPLSQRREQGGIWEPWLAIILAVLVLLCIWDAAHGAEIRITPDAEPLQTAIDRAAPGATLILAPGVYRANLRIHKPLTLQGEAGAVLDGGGQDDIIRITAADVTIRGLTLRNSGFNLTAMNAGVYVERGAHRVRIEDNRLENIAFGVWIWHAQEPLVRNNRILGNISIRSQDRGDGIRLFNVTEGVFANNEIRNTRDGMYIDTSSHNDLIANRFHDLRYGIHYMYTHYGRLIDNYSEGTRSGYALMMSRNLEIIGNRSVNDHNYGILMNFINYSTVAGNVVKGITGWAGGGSEHGIALGGEGKALFIYNSLYNEIRDNVFADSEIGIHLTAGSENNAIYANAFINNQTQVKYVANRRQEWSHEGRGNYWSDYLGWDLDGDGIGDLPYEPNDAVDKLLWKYPLAKMLMNSPAIQVLRWVQHQFPVLRSPGVRDSAPLMAPPQEGLL